MVMVTERQSGNLDSSSLQSLQFPKMIVTENLVKKKLKIKIASKKVNAEPWTKFDEFGQQAYTSNRCNHNISVNGTKKSEMNKSHKFVLCSSDKPKLFASDNLKVKLSVPISKKCGDSGMVDGQDGKRRRMDHNVKQQCSSILKTLMSHPSGWVFNQPVDPVALNIPDYRDIITDPMDLGTIKTKLEDSLYFGVEEFASDVRLTFSNAMLYNPPSNNVHHMAKELDNIFNRRWKILVAKWNREGKLVEQTCILSGRARITQDLRHTSSKNSPPSVSLPAKWSASSEEKKRLRKEPVEVDARATKRVPTKMVQNGGSLLLGKSVHKGTDNGNRSAFCSATAKPSLSLVTTKCVSCGSVTCQCRHRSDNSHAYSSGSDLTSEKSGGQGPQCVSKMDSEVQITLTSCMSKLKPDCDRTALDEANTCSCIPITSPTVFASSSEGWTPLAEVQLSPKKALRAAMLKSRFADTILKAKQKSLLDHGDKADPVKMQQEKVKLERQQREEAARIEAQIRASEAASKMRADAELKLQREKEREAARMAIQQMQKTVEIDDNLEILKDLEMLSGWLPSYFHQNGKEGSEVAFMAVEGGHHGNWNPLQRLGLFMKEDYIEDEDEEAILNGEGEEGEIFS